MTNLSTVLKHAGFPTAARGLPTVEMSALHHRAWTGYFEHEWFLMIDETGKWGLRKAPLQLAHRRAD